MLKNIGSNWALMAITGAATFLLMPFNLRHLGSSQYGAWLVIAALTAYLSLLHLGVPMASVRQMTAAVARRDQAALNRLVASCAALYLALGLAVGLLGVPLLAWFEHAYAVPDVLHATLRLAFILALIQTGVGFVAALPYAILAAHQSFVPKNMLMTAGVAARLVLNPVLILASPSVATLAAVGLTVSLLELTLAWVFVLRRYPALRPARSDISASALRGVVAMGAYVFLLALGSQLAFQTSALVIGHFMTSADVVTFGVPNSLMLILLQFIIGIAAVIMPLATNLQTNGDVAGLRALYCKWTQIALGLCWCAACYLLVFGPSFLALWIQDAYRPEAGHALRILMVSYLILLPVRGVAVPLMMGLGQVKGPTLATLAAGALNLLLSLIWVRGSGLAGAAWATLVPNVLLAVVITVQTSRALSLPLRAILVGIVRRAAVGGVAALALLGAGEHLWQPHSFAGLAAAGLFTTALCALIWTQGVLRADVHVPMPNLIGGWPRRLHLMGRLPWVRS